MPELAALLAQLALSIPTRGTPSNFRFSVSRITTMPFLGPATPLQVLRMGLPGDSGARGQLAGPPYIPGAEGTVFPIAVASAPHRQGLAGSEAVLSDQKFPRETQQRPAADNTVVRTNRCIGVGFGRLSRRMPGWKWRCQDE